MAKYTELFSEYLANEHVLPTSFSLIEGLDQKFIAFYYDKEIGFETEEMFEIKLKLYADLYIPLYKRKLDELDQAVSQFGTPNKVHTTSSRTDVNNGEQKTRGYALPTTTGSIEGIEASGIQVNEATLNSTEVSTSVSENGLTLDEQIRLMDEINKRETPIIMELLNEFKSLFMEVY